MRIVSLDCPKCGARLEISDRLENLACGYCGSSLYVDRSGGAISLQLAEAVGDIRTGAMQTAAELALVRLAAERNALESQVRQEKALILRHQNQLALGKVMSHDEKASTDQELRERTASIAGLKPIAYMAGALVALAITIVLWRWWDASSGFEAFVVFFFIVVLGLFATLYGFFLPSFILLGRHETRLENLKAALATHDRLSAIANELDEAEQRLAENEVQLFSVVSEIEQKRKIVSGA